MSQIHLQCDSYFMGYLFFIVIVWCKYRNFSSEMKNRTKACKYFPTITVRMCHSQDGNPCLFHATAYKMTE